MLFHCTHVRCCFISNFPKQSPSSVCALLFFVFRPRADLVVTVPVSPSLARGLSRLSAKKLHAPACGALEGVFGLPSRQGCSPVGGRDQGASGSWSLRVGHFFPTLIVSTASPAMMKPPVVQRNSGDLSGSSAPSGPYLTVGNPTLSVCTTSLI